MRCNEGGEGFEKMSQTPSDVESCVDALDNPSSQFAAKQRRKPRQYVQSDVMKRPKTSREMSKYRHLSKSARRDARQFILRSLLLPLRNPHSFKYLTAA
jgi:hypothetical protein